MKILTSTIVLAALACAAPVAAQNASPQAAPKPVNMGDLRHHIYVMEGALARAVDFGAKQLNREIAQVMPSVFMLEGEASARGLYLDGYGVFFDVSIPTMRQSMVGWSLRLMLEQDAATSQAAINELKKSMQGVTDQATRARMENAVRQLERANAQNVQNVPVRGDSVIAPGVVTPSAEAIPTGAAAASGMSNVRPAPPPSALRDSLWVKDPDRAYTEAVTRALVDAMIDYSAPMQIGSDQWLTVAARDDEGRDSLAPPDPMVEVVTWIYRIKGSDLQEYRQGRIDRDEVRRRVQLSQF
jgi:hypothetical protein